MFQENSVKLRTPTTINRKRRWNLSRTSLHDIWNKLCFSNFLNTLAFSSTNWQQQQRLRSTHSPSAPRTDNNNNDYTVRTRLQLHELTTTTTTTQYALAFSSTNWQQQRIHSIHITMDYWICFFQIWPEPDFARFLMVNRAGAGFSP